MAGHSKWNNIKHRKGAQDKKRASLFTKLGREVMVAAKEGGGDLDFNPRLRLAIEKAKAANMPKDVLERAIKKGTGELAGDEIMEIRYEGYGPAGTAFIVECVTDNKNRTASDVRSAFTRKGGNLGTDGAVAWKFKKCGCISVESKGKNQDEFMMLALEAGADDVIDDGEEFFEVITEFTKFQEVLENLNKAGVKYIDAEITMLPENKIEIKDLDTAKKVMLLFDTLDEIDDVQNVYADFDISEELLEQL
ncbi:MAG: YebC/PmpR family DNA-binding transcriptional regulator [Fusobacteriaceae bacterium]